MRYVIRYDRPGRIRLRCGSGAFTLEQGYGIEEKLCSDASILSVESSSVNGGLLINYETGRREHVLSLVSDLDRKKLPISRPKALHIARAKQEAFVKATAIEAGKAVLGAVLPAPVKVVIKTIGGISDWKKQYDGILTSTIQSYEAKDAAQVVAASNDGYTLASSVVSINVDNVPDTELGLKFKSAVAEVFAPTQEEITAAKQDIPSPKRAVNAVLGGRGKRICLGNCGLCITPCK